MNISVEKKPYEHLVKLNSYHLFLLVVRNGAIPSILYKLLFVVRLSASGLPLENSFAVTGGAHHQVGGRETKGNTHINNGR